MIATSRIVLVMFLWAICFPLITAGSLYAPHMTFAAAICVCWRGSKPSSVS